MEDNIEMNVAIIPARGGSKRIPGKNIREFLGQPLISYPIRAAMAAGVFEKIVVSTDSQEIAQIARDAGGEVPFMRPSQLSDDHTPTSPVVMHSLDWMKSEGINPDRFCCIYANPFVTAENLRKGFEMLTQRAVSSVVPVTTFPFPIFRAFRKTKDGNVEYIYPEYAMTRSQDLPEACHDVGQFYWCKTKRFVETGRIIQKDTCPLMIDRHLCQDLDTPEDWALAEGLYTVFLKKPIRS